MNAVQLAPRTTGGLLPFRLAIATIGNAGDPNVWSGTPCNIRRALMLHGVDVVAIDVTPPPAAAALWGKAVSLRLRAAGTIDRRQARSTRFYGQIYSWTAARRLRAAGHVDAVLQMGSEFLVRHRRIATFEDMTVVQAVQNDWDGFGRAMSPKDVEERIAQQSRIYRGASACFTTTDWARDSIVRDYGIEASKVHTVGLGPNRLGKAGARDWSRPRFLFIGADWTRKNGDAVVDAFRTVRRIHPSAQLDLVGGGQPDIRERGVIQHGHLPLGDRRADAALSGLFARATCLVAPSLFEPAGIVYVEAAHAGIPAIGTTAGGARDLIGHGGTVVDPRDTKGLAEAMLAFCDPQRSRTVGAAAAAGANDRSWEAVAHAIVARLALSVIESA